MPEVFSSAYRTFQQSSALEGGGKRGAWKENERKWMGFLISQLRSSEGVFAHVSMHMHRGVTEHSWARVCVRGCDQRGRICRDTPRQTDPWPGRQKNRQRGKWLKWVEIVQTGLHNMFPAEPLLIQFWQTHAACKNTKTWYWKKWELWPFVYKKVLSIKRMSLQINSNDDD